MKDRPILLQINVTANSGSHGKIAEAIGRHALEKGWRSIIAYGRAFNPSKSELIHIGNDWEIKEHVLESRFFDNHGLASRMATRTFINQIKQIKPDIIHLHVIHGYYLNYKILFEYLNSTYIPVVWTFHDPWAFTGHCGHYGSINCEKWKKQCEACPLVWKDYPKSIVDRSKKNFVLKKKLFTANKILHIVAVSEWLKNDVEQSFFKGIDIRVIHNGVDLDIFHPVKSVITGKKIVLGVASQWGPLKGLEDFYKLRKALSIDYEVILVGLNQKQIAQLPQGIKGIERTESVERLVELYSTASVFVNPTYADTFPTTNIEALACGTPVITYNTGGSPEAIDIETGVVVEKGDILGIVDSINQLSNMDRTQLRKACRKRAERLYNKEDRFQDYINLYEELLHEENSIG